MCATSGNAVAQGSGPTRRLVGDVPAGTTLQGSGPFFNVHDGVWNNGEDPTPVTGIDHGGYADFVDFVPVLDGNVHRYNPGTGIEGWQLISHVEAGDPPHVPAVTTNLYRLRGYFAPAALTPGQPVKEAAFELVVHQTQVAGPVLISIWFPASSERAAGPQDPTNPNDRDAFAYPGIARPDGLQDPGIWRANRGFVARSRLESAPYNVMSGCATPRVAGNNLALILQRNLQLARAMQAMLQSADASWRPPGWNRQTAKVACMAEGGSYGGYCTMWAVQLFPNDFHGAFSGGGPTSIRTYVGEQESHRYLQTLLGLGADNGRAYSPDMSFQHTYMLWEFQQFMKSTGGAVWDNWSPLFHTSVTRSWRDGTLRRPVYFLFGDEDAVHSGTATMSRFHGATAFVDHGEILASGGRPYVGWSIAAKRCHPGGVHTTASGTTNQWLLVRDMVEFGSTVIAAFNPAVPVTVTPPTPTNGTEDPFEWFCKAPPHTQPPQTTGPLTLDPTFGTSYPANTPEGVKRRGKAVGNGLWLGDRDSTLIHGQAIYCGSAEGVVTKYVVNPTTFEPEPVASTQALGYGAWALAIGNVTASPGDELVVGTHRGIHVIGLTPTAGFLPLLASKELPWEEFRPHHLKIADIDPSGVQEFAFATEGGDLVVCNVAGSSVNELWRHPEPGILDLECQGNYTFVLLSTRGFLIKIRRSLTPSGAEVLASSSRLFGIPVDLESRGNGQLVVLQTNVRAVPLQGTAGDSLRVFDAVTLADVPIGGPATVVTANPGPVGPAADDTTGRHDLEIVDADHWIVLTGNMLYGIELPGGTISWKRNLSTYSTTCWPLDIAAGNFVDAMQGPVPVPAVGWLPDREVVVATRTGYVTWLPLGLLATSVADVVPPPVIYSEVKSSNPSHADGLRTLVGSEALALPDNSYRELVGGAPAFSSRTTSGAWAMARRNGTTNELVVVDQAGTFSRINAVTGAVDYQYDLRRERRISDGSNVASHPVPASGPHRSIAFFGAASVGQLTPDPWLSVQDFVSGVPGSTTARTLDTRPFAPIVSSAFPISFGNYGLGRFGNGASQLIHVYDGYAVFPRGGIATTSFDTSAPASSIVQAHWWSGSEKTSAWPNLIEGAYFSSSGSPLDWWATCRHTPGGFGDDVPAADVAGNDLRDGFHLPLAQADAQSIAGFDDLTHGATRVVVGTAGGRAIVLDPALRNQVSAVQSESIDFGSGGMGLAVAPAIQAAAAGQQIEENLRADVYLGTLFTHAVPTNHQVPLPNTLPPDDAVAAVVWLEWTGGALAQHAVKVLDGSGPNNPKAYGVSGICAGDAIRDNNTEELVVTTMDGQLFVFARDKQGHVGSLLFQERLEGGVGPFNSILVADLDPAAPGNEIYVAGCLGLRKFRQP